MQTILTLNSLRRVKGSQRIENLLIYKTEEEDKQNPHTRYHTLTRFECHTCVQVELPQNVYLTIRFLTLKAFFFLIKQKENNADKH